MMVLFLGFGPSAQLSSRSPVLFYLAVIVNSFYHAGFILRAAGKLVLFPAVDALVLSSCNCFPSASHPKKSSAHSSST